MGQSTPAIQEHRRIRIERGLSDLMATRYDQLVAQSQTLYQLVLQKTKTIVERHQHILDIGCGTGIISLGIADRVADVTAIDLSPKMIAVAQEKAYRQAIANVYFQVADGYAVPFESQRFDLVILLNILHIVKEPDTLLAEAYRVLKPDGYLMTDTDCYAEPIPAFGMKTLVMAYRLLKALGITYLNMYRKADLLALFKKHGFTIIEDGILNPAPLNYYVAGQK